MAYTTIIFNFRIQTRISRASKLTKDMDRDGVTLKNNLKPFEEKKAKTQLTDYMREATYICR